MVAVNECGFVPDGYLAKTFLGLLEQAFSFCSFLR